MPMNEKEAMRCERWRSMLQHEFPTLAFHFWKEDSGEYLVRVRRTMQAFPHNRFGETLFEETFPTLFVGEFPPPSFIAKLALVS